MKFFIKKVDLFICHAHMLFTWLFSFPSRYCSGDAVSPCFSFHTRPGSPCFPLMPWFCISHQNAWLRCLPPASLLFFLSDFSSCFTVTLSISHSRFRHFSINIRSPFQHYLLLISWFLFLAILSFTLVVISWSSFVAVPLSAHYVLQFRLTFPFNSSDLWCYQRVEWPLQCHLVLLSSPGSLLCFHGQSQSLLCTCLQSLPVLLHYSCVTLLLGWINSVWALMKRKWL
jgi:hypothetical protein